MTSNSQLLAEQPFALHDLRDDKEQMLSSARCSCLKMLTVPAEASDDAAVQLAVVAAENRR